MGLQTPSSERIQIGFFGRRNAGKSSLINCITGQQVSVVSAQKGTTTDPVKKAMELLPLGPVVFIDTPGLDDEGDLGHLRIEQTEKVLRSIDLAVIVTEGGEALSDLEKDLLETLKKRNTPYLLVSNKSDLQKETPIKGILSVSAVTGEGIDELKTAICKLGEDITQKKPLVSDLVKSGDTVILVIPIDEAAPKGRIILPQQMVLRELLDAGAIPICCRDRELSLTLSKLQDLPSLVITDSQVFHFVAEIIPEDVPLTSFSILMARYKGTLSSQLSQVETIDRLEAGDRILIAEGCTHRRQCGDIGTVKLPKLLSHYTGKELKIETSSGGAFPNDLNRYALVLHCGGCMLNEKEMKFRTQLAKEKAVPMTNYGMAIAKMNGILKRATKILPEVNA